MQKVNMPEKSRPVSDCEEPTQNVEEAAQNLPSNDQSSATDLGIVANETAAKPSQKMNGKPVFVIPSTTVINFKSGFAHKLLCDGLTFTCGSACAYRCAYCYVSAILRRNESIKNIMTDTGLKFSEIVVRREHAVEQLRGILAPRGKRKFTDHGDNRVVYASPLVDVAANVELADETVQMCLAILELTHWQVRLLSKSPLILRIADNIPQEYHQRMIYGLSTGTLDDRVARAIEQGTPSVTKRLQALHALQDRGLRTFGMLCPILPQANVDEFASRAAEAIRCGQCEHVWAEEHVLGIVFSTERLFQRHQTRATR
jgi:DNA repair photolyase